MATQPPTVTIGARVGVELVRPRPIEQQALYLPPEGSTAQWVAHCAAALRMSWPEGVAWPILQRPPSWRLRDRVDEYGGAIYDVLIRAGIPEADVVNAGKAALSYALGVEPVAQADVDAAKGFSEPPAEPASAGG